ncbi:hypothetical protein [Methanococcus voltae]|uniref:Uncharacterized protein n=1 Tax=Methanococcus voltae (strain ATCC BAA-1334 / A3) TaxID=456320 RepID=D7DST5_METV3|nr:hypothetical protein [Methanococcus voltae]MCS3901796.1 hypothetical protein [Methanococcus voltae]
MTSNELTIELKQHTPMIHFQHEQSGATLRGTELKPKLDKFLKKYAFENNIEQYKTFLIGYNTEKEDKEIKNEAFDYRVTIKVSRENNAYDISKNPFNKLFFGNSGFGNRDKYKFKMYNEIELKIFSFHTELITKIQENIESFFAITNFGARQNKGFGSFTVKKINGTDKNTDFNELYKKLLEKEKKFELNEKNRSKIVAIYEYSKFGDMEEAVRQIAYDYKYLKSGLTEEDFKLKDDEKDELQDTIDIFKEQYKDEKCKIYKKSLLMEYFNNPTKKTYWEKRFIKYSLKKAYNKKTSNSENLFNDLKGDKNNKNLYKNSDKKQDYDYKFIRPLLGLGTGFRFMKKESPKKFINIGIKNRSNNPIERYQSPIYYKVIDNMPYMICYETNAFKNVQRYSFKPSLNKKDNYANLKLDKISDLEVPSDFDIKDFLEKNMKELDYEPVGVNNDKKQ